MNYIVNFFHWVDWKLIGTILGIIIVPLGSLIGVIITTRISWKSNNKKIHANIIGEMKKERLKDIRDHSIEYYEACFKMIHSIENTDSYSEAQQVFETSSVKLMSDFHATKHYFEDDENKEIINLLEKIYKNTPLDENSMYYSKKDANVKYNIWFQKFYRRLLNEEMFLTDDEKELNGKIQILLHDKKSNKNKDPYINDLLAQQYNVVSKNDTSSSDIYYQIINIMRDIISIYTSIEIEEIKSDFS